MSNNMLLAICAGLVCFGVFTIAGSPGFFILLGAGMLGAGGAAAYLILSHRTEQKRN